MTVGADSPGRLVEFPSQGVTLRGRLYSHESDHPGPVVVMAHGFSATITGMVADRYAEVLHATGLNVLLFEHRGFGLSEGTPRRTIERWVEARGYRDAIDFIVSRPEVDESRVALRGDSHSGSTAVGVAAFDERVRALVVQVPACGREPAPADPDGTDLRTLRDTFYEPDLDSLRQGIVATTP